MLYMPNFCSQSGEKIDRVNWNILTSRRFCENCEQDFRAQEWLPKGLIGLAVIGCVFGFGSYLRKSDKPLNVTTETVSVAPNKTQKLQN